MKNIVQQSILSLLCGAALTTQAGTPVQSTASTPSIAEAAGCCHHYADSPIGVMFDHTHAAGGFMVGYRYFRSEFSGLQKNGSGISTDVVFDDGFTAAPTAMSMDMHMLEIMYSPTDWLTLMVMPMYMEMDMTMQMGGHSAHGGHGQAEHGHGGHSASGTHDHGTSGWGDTNVSAIFKLWSGEHQQLLGAIGVSIPTGSVDEKVDGRFTHYMMQLGSGTWDLTPSITYKGHAGKIFWGAQYLGAIRLEERNESGYRLGNVHQGTIWTGVDLCEWVNITGRALYRHEGTLRHHYNGPHSHSSPPDLQANYGGNTLDLGVGLNFVIPKGVLKGNRFSVEALFPVDQDLNGIQLERDFTLVAGWQWSF
jgi:hypothetical protein